MTSARPPITFDFEQLDADMQDLLLSIQPTASNSGAIAAILEISLARIIAAWAATEHLSDTQVQSIAEQRAQSLFNNIIDTTQAYRTQVTQWEN